MKKATQTLHLHGTASNKALGNAFADAWCHPLVITFLAKVSVGTYAQSMTYTTPLQQAQCYQAVSDAGRQ